jgi:hypothetical protein
VNKQRSHRFHTERFNLKKLNEVRVKRSIMLRYEIGLQLFKIRMLKWIVIVFGELLDRI